MRQQLIVYLKAPHPGAVKTRLIPALGPEGAARAYQRLVAECFEGIRGLPDVELRFAPDHARGDIAHWLEPSWTAQPQGTGSLGERLARSFEESFAGGAERVVAIGTDTPDIRAADIHAAWSALHDFDLVLGPATDGGYWLIGMRRFAGSVFDEIPWSTAGVLGATLERARRLGWSVTLLGEKNDIDRPEDWLAFLASRTAPSPQQPEPE